MQSSRLDQIIADYNADPREMLAMFMQIQEQEGYLPQGDLEYLAKKLNRPLAQLYQLATFYEAFSLKPQGRHRVHVCMGTACHVRGAAQVLSGLEQLLKLKPGEVTPDGQFGLKTVNCVGACALGPVVQIDGEYHGHVSALKLEKIFKKYSKEAA